MLVQEQRISDPLRHVTLRQLQIFRIAAEASSFATAARRLHITQPAVSMQMAQLSDIIGAPLFEKIGRSMVPTIFGKALLPFVDRIGASLLEAQKEIRSLKENEPEVVRVSAETAAQYFLPHLAVRCQREIPKIHLRIDYANQSMALDRFKEQDADIAVVSAATDIDSYTHLPLGRQAYVFAIAASHKFARRKTIEVSTLTSQTLILRELGSGCRRALDQWIEASGSAPSKTIVLSSTEAIKQAVIAGLGSAMLPLDTIRLERRARQLTVLDVPGTPIEGNWYLVLRGDAAAPSSRARLATYMASEWSRLLSEHHATNRDS